MKRLLISLMFATAATAAFAQQMPDLTPPAELKKLDWMLGTWTGTMAMDMEGMKFDSVGTMKIDYDGKFMRTVSAQDMMGMKMTESMFLSYNAAKKEYVSWAYTNFSSNPRIEHGNFEGEKFVMISEPWVMDVSPEPTISRSTFLKKSATTVLFTLEFKMADKWVKVGEGLFTKSVVVK